MRSWFPYESLHRVSVQTSIDENNKLLTSFQNRLFAILHANEAG